MIKFRGHLYRAVKCAEKLDVAELTSRYRAGQQDGFLTLEEFEQELSLAPSKLLVRQAKTIHDLTPEYLQQMRKNDFVRVFHATGIDSHDSASGPQNMVFGIDATGQQSSHYHPSAAGGHQYRGLYVGPTKRSVGQFGRLVFEFVVRVRNLHATDWSGNISRQWEKGEAGTWQGNDLRYLKQKCDAEYPDSFDPLLSGALDTSARDSCGNLIRGHEPQALFVGIAPAADIVRVHYIDKSFTPQEFIDQHGSDLGWSEKTELDPKSTRLSWEDYESIVRERFGEKDMQQVASTLFRYRVLYSEAKVMELLSQIAPFSGPSARRLWSMVQDRYCDEFVQMWEEISTVRPDIKMRKPVC